MTVLGIDYGTKRVGLALAGPYGARRWRVVPNNEILPTVIMRAITEHQIGTVVVGLPRNLEGEDTAQTALVRRFAADLERTVDVPVVLQDEADTTNLARRRLAAAGLSSAEIERELDAEAAAMIAEDFWREG